MAGRTVARGYDARHVRTRARWAPLVARGDVACVRCGFLIRAGSAWDLDHDSDRSGYLGPAHAHCNRRAGGRAGGLMTGARARRRAALRRLAYVNASRRW